MDIKKEYFSSAIILFIYLLVNGCDTGEVEAPLQPTDAPTNLSAKTISPSEIQLSWKDNSSDEDGFIIERKTGNTPFDKIAQIAMPDTESYRDESSSLNPGTTYRYRVAYYKGSEISDYSNDASITTPALPKPLFLNKQDISHIPIEASLVLKLLRGEIEESNASDYRDNTFQYYDFDIVTAHTDEDAWYYSMDGALTVDSCNWNKFSIKTLQPLYRPSAFICPIEGEIFVDSGDRKVTIRFLQDQTVAMDINSDGIVEDTVSCPFKLEVELEPELCQ